MGKRNLPAGLTLPLIVFAAALLLQAALAGFLLDWTGARFRGEILRLQQQISLNLAAELARALAGNDDLAALAALRDARTHYPQLREALVFDNAGKVLLHTDSGMLGKIVTAPSGPRLTSPETVSRKDQGRPVISILVPLPDRDDGYFRASFDETRLAQGGEAVGSRAAALLVIFAAALAFLVWYRQRSGELAHAARRASEPGPAAKPGLHPNRIAQLLLAEMPHAALVIDRDNRIIAANSLVLELLNCRAEELETMHVLSAPLPPAVSELYQTGLKAPAKPVEAKMSLTPRSPALTARAAFAPPTSDWEVAVLSFR
jgi:PAS domain-containing protein